jgi:hypothetical protein
MIIVAVTALLLGAYRIAGELRFWTLSYGWNTSVLPIGLEVLIIEDVPSHQSTTPTGTRGVVAGDFTDEDSAYPNRFVSVRLSEGPGKTQVIHVKRTAIRAR